jgi:hypothetical protein
MEEKNNDNFHEDNHTEIYLQTWDPTVLQDKVFSMLIFGSRHSGKSELFKYIYGVNKFMFEYDFTVVMSESDDTLDFMSEFIPGNMFIKGFKPNIIEQLMSTSEKFELEGKKFKYLLVIDDIVGSDIKNNDYIAKAYAICRHYNISVVLICQRLNAINMTARNNSDILLIGKCRSSQEKETIIKTFLRGFARKDIDKKSEYKFYNDLLNDNTADYNFVVLDNFSNSNKFEEVIQTIRAPQIK